MINFTKMHGLGNDFMVIDNTKNQINLNATQIKKLANRHFGIGFDQLLIVEKSYKADIDFRYIIYNASGEQVEQCGNGARCFARFVKQQNLINKNPIIVETIGGIMNLTINPDDSVTVDMGIPSFELNNIIKNHTIQDTYHIANFEMGLVSTGNPHAVLIVENINKIAVAKIGKTIQQDRQFLNGVNVGFMQIISANEVKLRVYERGVGETLACGSGACAAVAFGIKTKNLNNIVTVHLNGGDCLIEKINNNIFLSGPAEFVFTGQIKI